MQKREGTGVYVESLFLKTPPQMRIRGNQLFDFPVRKLQSDDMNREERREERGEGKITY